MPASNNTAVAERATGHVKAAPPPRAISDQVTVRQDARKKAMAQGADEVTAERVADAAARRAQAEAEGRPFIYVDVEQEFKDLLSERGDSPVQIASAKLAVWSVARQVSEARDVSIEEALFFCFSEALTVAQETGEAPVEARTAA
jgi:hypothetical protein